MIGTTEMIDIFIAFVAGALAGHWAGPKDPELEEQKAIYEKKIEGYVTEIVYYKQLCQWHVERAKEYDKEKDSRV